MINKVILLGRTGKDPEVRQANSVKVASFSLATSEKYKNKNGETVENTEWHNISCFGNLAEIAEKYIKKGDQIYLEGKIHTNSWEDKDGNKRYSTGIIANEIRMLGGKKEEAKSDPIINKNDDYSGSEPTDDLPF